MELYVIRHGKTLANEKHLYCGATDLPLTEAEISELREVHYQVPDNSRYITSDMLRTEQTLRCLFGEVEHEKDPRFREVDFGVFEMHSYEELKDRPDYQAWISGDNEANVPPEGESGVQMCQRILAGLQELQTVAEPVVLITHGGVIASMMAALFPEEQKNRYEWQPKPGEGYHIVPGGFRKITRSPRDCNKSGTDKITAKQEINE